MNAKQNGEIMSQNDVFIFFGVTLHMHHLELIRGTTRNKNDYSNYREPCNTVQGYWLLDISGDRWKQARKIKLRVSLFIDVISSVFSSMCAKSGGLSCAFTKQRSRRVEIGRNKKCWLWGRVTFEQPIDVKVIMCALNIASLFNLHSWTPSYCCRIYGEQLVCLPQVGVSF